MKRKVILLLAFFLIGFNPTFSNTKSNYLFNFKDSIHFININNNSELIFSKFINGPFDLFNFNEPRSGKYNEISRKTPPFTFFDDGNISNIRSMIRYNISYSKKNFHRVYLDIFNLLDGSKLLPACSHDLICNEAYKAKAAAFVYFIGLDKQHNDLGNVGDPAREYYYNLAVNFIKGARISKDRFNGLDRQRYRAFELIQYLQGFDYLYTTRFFSGVNNYSTFPDKNEITDILCDFTTELHSAANNLRQSYAVNNNITIIISSAVGMSACIFNQRAVRFWQNQKKPERWGHAAHAYIARTLFEGPAFTSFSGAGPMSVKNEIGGYAEGQHYFAYGFQALIPFMKTYYQSIGIKSLSDESDMGGRAYWPCALCPKSVPQEPYNSKSYLNIYKWYRNILLPNQEPPTIDDTWKKDYPFTGIALIGNKENNPFTEFNKLSIGLLGVGEDGYNLYIDYLLTLNYPIESEIPEIVEFKKSGDLIIKDNLHYLHVNAETDNSNNGGYHEHGDVTSFLIGAGNMDILAMDPPYYGESDRNEVRKGKHHNVITIDEKGPNKRDDVIYSEIKKDISYSNTDPNMGGEVFNEIGVNATYWKYLLGVRVGEKITVNRKIERHNYQYPYYVVNDLVKNISMTGYANICFNINGDGDENTTGTFEKINASTFLWKRPCTIDNNPADNWKMYSTTFGNDGTSASALAYDSNSDPKNGTQVSNQNHTRASVCQPIPSNEERQFTTIIEILPCNATAQALKEVRLSPKFTTYRTAPKENSIVIHLSHDVLPKLIDTVLDPLRINQNAVFHTDAKFSFFHYSTNSEFKSGNCISYCNFRMARISEGSLFKYHDTTYLESTKIATAYYSLIGKCKYKAYIETDTACSVSFYLADVDTGVGMKVNGLPYTYNTLTCIMQVDVPIGLTQFEIELEDPCRVSCFFPSTAETINGQFDFSEGITQTLGHKLSIVKPNGFLNITNGSHMMLCDGIYLHNRDSLVLFSGCGKVQDK